MTDMQRGVCDSVQQYTTQYCSVQQRKQGLRFMQRSVVNVCLFATSHLALFAVQPQVKPQQSAPNASTNATAAGPKAKQQISQLKKLKLIETLALDEAAAEKFFVRYNSEQKKVDDARKALDDVMRELEKVNSTPGTATDKIKQLTEQTLEKHTQMQNAVAEMLRSLRSTLNEQQYAKFLVFEARFQEQIRKTLLDIKHENKKNTPDAAKITQPAPTPGK